jgi:hypothetical protein
MIVLGVFKLLPLGKVATLFVPQVTQTHWGVSSMLPCSFYSSIIPVMPLLSIPMIQQTDQRLLVHASSFFCIPSGGEEGDHDVWSLFVQRPRPRSGQISTERTLVSLSVSLVSLFLAHVVTPDFSITFWRRRCCFGIRKMFR